MWPIIPRPAITRRQKNAALAVAMSADFLQMAIFPMFAEGVFSPFDDALDFLVAVVLIAVCGFKWQFILAFMLELVPGLDLLPTWTAVVLTLRVESRENASQTKINQPAEYPPIHVSAVVVPPKSTSDAR